MKSCNQNYDFEIGEEIKKAIESNLYVEKCGPVYDRVKQVCDRLNAARNPGKPLKVHVPWYGKILAFTFPGRNIYISRQMVQLCRNDHMLAMVIAHEMAHHDLGHTRLSVGSLIRFLGFTVASYIAIVLRNVRWFFKGPEEEVAADQYGLNLCITAGYDPTECVKVFELLEKHCIDHRDIDAVYGSKAALDHEMGDESLFTQFEKWLDERIRGYLPIRIRVKRLKKVFQHLKRKKAKQSS